MKPGYFYIFSTTTTNTKKHKLQFCIEHLISESHFFLNKTIADVIMDSYAQHYKNKLMLLLEVSPLTFVARRWLKKFLVRVPLVTPSSSHLSINIIRDRITYTKVTKLTQITNFYNDWGFNRLFIFTNIYKYVNDFPNVV